MTDQPHAEPTPWTALPYDSDWECARVVDPLHGICDVFGDPETATARAKLFAAAPETAAERDRLVEVNERLVVALRKAILWTDEEHDVDNWRPLASAALVTISLEPGEFE